MAFHVVNRSEAERQYKQKQAGIIQNLAAEAGAKVTHRGSTWWEIAHDGKVWKVRGASNVVRILKLLGE
jgi:hypothetical protein